MSLVNRTFRLHPNLKCSSIWMPCLVIWWSELENTFGINFYLNTTSSSSTLCKQKQKSKSQQEEDAAPRLHAQTAWGQRCRALVAGGGGCGSARLMMALRSEVLLESWKHPGPCFILLLSLWLHAVTTRVLLWLVICMCMCIFLIVCVYGFAQQKHTKKRILLNVCNVKL